MQNFNIGNQSQSYSITSSPSSSENDDINLLNDIEMINAEEEALLNMSANNNICVLHFYNQRNKEVIHGGSVLGHRIINRNRQEADRNLFNDYFSENPRYNASMFRRRFRMSRSLFIRIATAIQDYDNYFIQKSDATGKLGLSGVQKIPDVFRMLAYGVPADSTDEYIKIGESTTIEILKRFCRAVLVEIFGGEYLRSPNGNDVSRLLNVGKQRGFSGMLGSLDCMHWKWKNCPTAWAGQYAGRSGHPTIILESVADYELWIWHAYFDLPGSNNDINVLESSNLFANLASGIALTAYYVIRGKEYEMGYYLADGIYPKWSTILQSIHDPRGHKKQYFTMKQESCRKDVERAFEVLQSHMYYMI